MAWAVLLGHRKTKLLWLLLAAIVARPSVGNHERKLSQKNCSVSPCWNAENICGSYTHPCVSMGRVQSGPEIWVAVSFKFGYDGLRTYVRTERASFSQQDCEANNAWIEIEYVGNWHQDGPSVSTLGFNLAHTDVHSASVTLLRDEVCLEQSPWTTQPQTCLNTLATVTVLCPCNGWDWSSKGSPQERNIGMFCQPREQCPLMNDVYVGETHFYSFNATPASACFSKASLMKERGWNAPKDEGCFSKTESMTCPWARLSHSTRSTTLSPFARLLFGVLIAFSVVDASGGFHEIQAVPWKA